MTHHSAFTENLGSDWIAVNANGVPIGRAGDEQALRHAVPDAKEYLNAKTLVLDGQDLPRAAEGSVNSALDKIAAQSTPAVDAKPAPVVEAVKPVADGSRFDHDNDGKAGGAPKGGNRKAAKK